MIREYFLQNVSLWACAWQSTSFALIGLIVSYFLRPRPARASQVLFLGLVASVIVPVMAGLVKHFEWGLFAVESSKDRLQVSQEFTPVILKMSADVPTNMDNIDEIKAPVEQAILAEVDSDHANISWRMLVLYGWMLTSLIVLGRLLISIACGVYLRRRSKPITCEQIKRAVDSAGLKLSITGDLQVRSSDSIRSPVIWCWSRSPVLLIPSEFDHEVDWIGVICHEVAHCKRKDHLTGLIAELVVCILPWNPLLWWSKKRMVRFGEQTCDDWVIAGGCSREDYAQSLLDFKPQKQIAFVPAVVSSKKTLSGRVHRILEDTCGNPRTGAVWALTASVIAIFLAAGIAFAQTKPAHPTGTIKTKLGGAAAIEQLAADTIMITGQILDPNNEPACSARVVALPFTSWGYRTGGAGEEGYFELPWSPTWIDKDRPICLVARGGNYRSDEAAIVEILDPTQPVTVRLEPTSLAIEGVILDPDGRPLEHYTATLSLPTEFKCRAPILATDVWSPRVRMSLTVPYGPKYKLAIKAEGFRTEQLAVDASDRSKDIIDIGTIILQRHDPAKPVVSEEHVDPDLAREFREIYKLEEYEVLKFVKAPFVLGRQEYLHAHGGTAVFPLGLQAWATQCGFTWDGELKVRNSNGTVSPSLKYTVLWLMLDMQLYDFSVPRGLNIHLPHGDWIVRHESPLAEQLAALEDILRAESGRSIHFEKRTVEREVIIAKGRYEFRSHPSGSYPEHVHVTFDGAFGSGSGSSNSLEQMFSRIEWEAEVEVVDETEPIEDTRVRYRVGNIRQIARDPELRSERLRALADNLAMTTSLQIEVERRPAEVWFVTEESNE